MIRLLKWVYRQYNQKIQLRLTVYFLFILLPLVAVSLFANFRSREILLEQTAERTEAALTSSMDYIDLTLQNVEEISTLIATDSNLLKLLDQAGPELSPQSVASFTDLLKQLSNITSINHMISQISVFHARSNTVISTYNGSRRIADPAYQNWLKQLAVKNGTGIYYLLPDEPAVDGQSFGSVIGTDGISLVRTMDLNNPDRQPNLLIVTLNKTKLLGLIRSLLPSQNAQIYLFTNKGKLVTGTGEGGSGPVSEWASDEDMFTVKVDSRYYKWSLLLVQPREEVYAKTNQARFFTFIIIGISVLLAIWISWAVYSGIASPVQRLMQGMKRAGSGNFNIRLENKRDDEFGFLTQAFNQMVYEQKQLIENYYEQQLRLAQTELRFLQSQINPHFLYNTMDSIYWAAKNYEAEEISEMVLNLSRFFRLSLNKGSDTFTVEESVAHLHFYIRVQQLRFLDKFSVSYDIDEAAKPVPILKLLLQPLVENAILHGLEQRERGGELSVRASVENGFLRLTVQDNGVGMTPERLAYVREELDQLTARDDKGLTYVPEQSVQDMYGLRNVASRIRMVYGKRARILVDSAAGEGTTVTVSLPLDRCQEQFELFAGRPEPELREEVS